VSIDGSTPVSITARLDAFARVAPINPFCVAEITSLAHSICLPMIASALFSAFPDFG
jgi:hypothetical protein